MAWALYAAEMTVNGGDCSASRADIAPIAEKLTEKPEEILTVLLQDPIPRWQVWVPLIGWLIERLDTWPDLIRPEAARLLEIWQQKTPLGSIYRKEIGEIALSWLYQTERWHDDNEEC